MPRCPEGTIIYRVQPYDTLWQIAERHHTTIYEISALNPGLDLNYLDVGQHLCIRPWSRYYPPTRRPAQPTQPPHHTPTQPPHHTAPQPYRPTVEDED